MRSDYKRSWTAASRDKSQASKSVAATDDEVELERSGKATTQFLLDHVGILPGDVVLEIGCGIGRVGKHIARHCQQQLCERWRFRPMGMGGRCGRFLNRGRWRT